MGWLRATYLTVGSFINFLFAIALVASAYAYIIPCLLYTSDAADEL